MNFLNRDNELMLFGLSKENSSSRGVIAFISVYAFATLVGAILCPLLYWLTEFFNELYPNNETFLYLLDKGVDKYFDRARWLGVVIGLPILFRYCRLNSLKSMGLNLNKSAGSNFLKYFLLGCCVMLFIYSMQFAFTNVSIKEISFAKMISVFFGASLGALALGLLEELIFRGLIFRCFYTAWGALPATLLSSLFFAYKHFKVPACAWEHIRGGLHTAHWYTGFEVAYYDTIGIFLDFRILGFCSLLLLAMFLCVLYIKTKNLYSCIAFHAALVFSLKLHRGFFVVKDDNLRNFFGNSAAINSYLAVIILSILLIFSIFYIKKKEDIS